MTAIIKSAGQPKFFKKNRKGLGLSVKVENTGREEETKSNMRGKEEGKQVGASMV